MNHKFKIGDILNDDTGQRRLFKIIGITKDCYIIQYPDKSRQYWTIRITEYLWNSAVHGKDSNHPRTKIFL